MISRKKRLDEEANAFIPSSDESTGSTQDSEDDTERFCRKCGAAVPSNAAYCPKCGAKQVRKSRRHSSCDCGRRCCCCCCCCLCLIFALVLLTIAVVILTMNVWIKFGLEQAGFALFGTQVAIGDLDLGLLQGRTTITDLDVASPPGYEGSFFNLGRFVFDLSPKSVLSAWLTGWIMPIHLREITIQNISVFIDMNWTQSGDEAAGADCNAKTIVHHMNKAVEPLPTISPEETRDIGLHALTAKIQVDRVELSNVSAEVRVRPFLSAPVSYDLKEVLVQGIGERGKGVYLWEFAEILARSILMAVIKSAPDNIRGNLAKILGPDLFRNLDYQELFYDAGEGLCKISEFTGWAAGEATLLPLKWASLSARINGKAIATGAALNLKATELGVKANLAATRANIKANEGIMKLRNRFTMGWLHALAR